MLGQHFGWLSSLKEHMVFSEHFEVIHGPSGSQGCPCPLSILFLMLCVFPGFSLLGSSRLLSLSLAWWSFVTMCLVFSVGMLCSKWRKLSESGSTTNRCTQVPSEKPWGSVALWWINLGVNNIIRNPGLKKKIHLFARMRWVDPFVAKIRLWLIVQRQKLRQSLPLTLFKTVDDFPELIPSWQTFHQDPGSKMRCWGPS